MFDVFISVYVFVYTQTLVDVGDLSVIISRHLSVLVGSLYVYVFVYTQTLVDVSNLSLTILRHSSVLVGSL